MADFATQLGFRLGQQAALQQALRGLAGRSVRLQNPQVFPARPGTPANPAGQNVSNVPGAFVPSGAVTPIQRPTGGVGVPTARQADPLGSRYGGLQNPQVFPQPRGPVMRGGPVRYQPVMRGGPVRYTG